MREAIKLFDAMHFVNGTCDNFPRNHNVCLLCIDLPDLGVGKATVTSAEAVEARPRLSRSKAAAAVIVTNSFSHHDFQT